MKTVGSISILTYTVIQKTILNTCFRITAESRVPFKYLLLMPFQKLYTVCDVAMNIIMSKSTTYSLESPKDPVLPARFFTQPDKVVTLEFVCVS